MAPHARSCARNSAVNTSCSAQVGVTAKFAFDRSRANARLLFYASIIYLPLLWIVMTVTR